MSRKRPVGGRGFSLVEVVLALGIMSFCLIALMGLLSVGLTTIKDSSEETAGINVTSAIISDLEATPATTQLSPTYQLSLPATGGGAGQAQVLYLDQAGAPLPAASSTGARYKVTVTMSAPSAQNTVTGDARLTWPAQAANPVSAVEVYFALDRN